MVEAAVRGAGNEPEVETIVLHAAEAGASEVLKADGYIFATPENLAAMSGVMKDFFDRTYYAVLDRVVGRPYAVLVCAGSDGTNAVRQIERITTGWRLKPAAPALVACTRAQTCETIMRPKTIAREDLGRCEQVGATLAGVLALGLYG
jgi:NAD(P)H-dependent FMN reductase